MKVDPNKEPASADRLSIADVVAATGLSAGYLRKVARSGSLPGVVSKVVGRGSWTFDRVDVEEWIQARHPDPLIPGDEADESWVQDMLLAENASQRIENLSLRLAQSESEVARLKAENELLARELVVVQDAFAKYGQIRHPSDTKPASG